MQYLKLCLRGKRNDIPHFLNLLSNFSANEIQTRENKNTYCYQNHNFTILKPEKRLSSNFIFLDLKKKASF